MTELWLKYRDENGDDRRVLVAGKEFVIGRHSGCDLYIPNGQLSRRHVKIESFAEVFVVSDLGSSNGTTLNDEPLEDPVSIKDGDVLNLGGGLDIQAEIVSDRPKAASRSAAEADSGGGSSSGASGGSSQSASVAGGSSIPTAVFIIAPALVIVFLVCGGGLLIFSGGYGNNNNRVISTYSPTPFVTPDETPDDSPTPRPSATVSGNVSPSPETTSTQPTPEISGEKKKVEAYSAAFLQRIAKNDPTAFLRSTEVDIVSAKLAAFKNSSALAQNLKAVKANDAQFRALAESKGLTPQFLAVAALAEIGGGSGNPLEVAKTMLPVFGELRTSLANNLADDNLLMIASYDRGKAGKYNELRNALEALAKKNPSVSPREIRTIWFLKKQGKISDAEYEFALRFLAIGTIAQNPKDFGVNAEAVVFN